MEFTAPLASFLKPLQHLCRIAGSAKPSSSAAEEMVSFLMLEIKDSNLIIMATDYKVQLSYSIPVSSISEGRILVSAEKLSSTLSRVPAQSLITFIADEDNEDGTLIIQSGNTRYRLRFKSKFAFPDFNPNHEEVEQVLAVEQGKLRRMIDSSIFCVSAEEFREYLRGVRFEAEQDMLTIFTSDGHRMAMVESRLARPLDNVFKVTLLQRSAEELKNILQNSDEVVELNFTRNMFTASCNGYSLAAKLLICNYPNVRGVLPKEIVTSVKVNRSSIKDEVAKVAVLSSKRVNGVNMVFTPGELKFRAENSEHEVATSKLDIDYDGPEVDITLNATYVNGVLGAIESENVLFEFSRPLVSAMLKPADLPENAPVQTRYIISRVVV